MNLKKILSEDVIRVGLKGATKQEIIEELLDILVTAGRVTDRREALKVLLERENKMSTALQNGLALPHAKTDVVDRLVGAMGIKPEGVAFQSIDGQPTRIFILTMSPFNRAGPHIQFLAEVGRLVSDPAVRAKILEAKTPGEVADLMPA